MNILIAVDDSTSSLESARCFRELTHQGDVNATVLTVVGLPTTALTESIGHTVSEFVTDALKHDEHAFASVVKIFEGSKAHLAHITRYGHVGHCIAAAAEEINADLIVVGAKSKSPHDHVTHESVSEYVATHATCSVLVVSPRTASQQQLDHPLRITIAYDDSKESKAAIEQFGSYLWVRNADIEVVSVVPIHAVQRDGMDPVELPNSPSVVHEATAFTERAANQLRSQGIRATSRVVEAKHIGSQIAGFAKQHNSDLIVIGSQGQSGIARILLGSTAQYVLRHSDHLVWIVREMNV